MWQHHPLELACSISSLGWAWNSKVWNLSSTCVYPHSYTALWVHRDLKILPELRSPNYPQHLITFPPTGRVFLPECTHPNTTPKYSLRPSWLFFSFLKRWETYEMKGIRIRDPPARVTGVRRFKEESRDFVVGMILSWSHLVNQTWT